MTHAHAAQARSINSAVAENKENEEVHFAINGSYFMQCIHHNLYGYGGFFLY